jgi:hypothetical protein
MKYLGREWKTNSSGSGTRKGVYPELFRIWRNQVIMSKNFEQWSELAAQVVREQDSVKLTELARKMNLALNQKTPILDPPTRNPSE